MRIENYDGTYFVYSLKKQKNLEIKTCILSVMKRDYGHI